MLEYWARSEALLRYNGFWDTEVLGLWSAEGGTIKLKMDIIL